MMWDDDLDDWPEDRKAKKKKVSEEEAKARAERTRSRHIMRRAMSEHRLREILDWRLEEGTAYHVISGGDVDMLSFVRVIVESQPIDYLMVSTWVMSLDDAEEMADWLAKGYVKRIDLYAGERSIEHYARVWDFMEGVLPRYGGRMVTFKNHSKVSVLYGRDLDVVIESSANMNEDPRCEQTAITVSTDLADFYKAYFDERVSIRPWRHPWEAWSR